MGIEDSDSLTPAPAARASRGEARVLKSPAEIEEIRGVWTGWQSQPNVDLDFYLLINQQRKQVLRPHVILVLCGGKPKAMAVGRLEQGSVDIKFGYKSIANFPVVMLHVIHGGLLGEQTPEVAEAILASLKQSLRSGEAEVLTFSAMPVESEIAKLLPDKVSFLCRNHFEEKRLHWKMALGGTVDESYARLSRDHRQQLRRKAKAFERDFPGGLAVRCFREVGEIEQMTAEVEEIAKKTYQRGLGAGFIDNEENRKRVELEARQGRLRMYVLYVKAKPCAYWWGTSYNNIYHSAALGFDTEYGKYSPGTYLMTKVLEDLCKQGVKELDFGLGDARYKQQFGNEHWCETTISVFAARPRLIAMNLVKTLNGGLMAGALAIARRFNVVDIIKRRWRNTVAPK